MSDTSYLYRHPQDRNLWIYNGYFYNGMPLIWQKGPFIYNYLQRLDETIQGALNDHADIMAVRVDLRLPLHSNTASYPIERPVFNRFIESLKAKIAARQAKTVRKGKRFHRTKVHYAWTREFGHTGNAHYHCVLFFNKQTFQGLGEFNPHSGSLYSMISGAWANALRLDQSVADALIHIPENPIYRINRKEKYNALFYRISYFAKLATKQFGTKSHNFGTSRTKQGTL
ncbi:inovirus Gp2 family protein [Marinobacter sp. C2H3]|uniref:inovirus Gp2 family protein n=1 Tax=Marinobacter sp. C2H3 TaxID=3119003 RepID=UPI00300F6FF8